MVGRARAYARYARHHPSVLVRNRIRILQRLISLTRRKCNINNPSSHHHRLGIGRSRQARWRLYPASHGGNEISHRHRGAGLTSAAFVDIVFRDKHQEAVYIMASPAGNRASAHHRLSRSSGGVIIGRRHHLHKINENQKQHGEPVWAWRAYNRVKLNHRVASMAKMQKWRNHI